MMRCFAVKSDGTSRYLDRNGVEVNTHYILRSIIITNEALAERNIKSAVPISHHTATTLIKHVMRKVGR